MSEQEKFRSTSTTIWTYVGPTVLVAHRPGALLETDFELFHSEVSARTGLTGIIVLAHNAPPAPKQRATIQEWFRRRDMRGAVLTNSLLARGGVTALGWLGVNIAAFRREEIEAGVDFVRVAPEHRAGALQALRALDAECA